MKILGKVISDESKCTKLKKRVREIHLVDTEMKELKVTVFGNIPKMDRLGLRKGSVLEVSGIILHSGSRYICVSYDRLGSMIRVLPKDNELSKHVLSTIGKKRKSKSNISQPTETQTIKYLKDNRLSGLFKIQKCTISQFSPNTYLGCKKCKTKKTENRCASTACTSRSKKKVEILVINVTLEDETARGENGVKAVMFQDVCTSVMGIKPKTFMKKSNMDQRSLCIDKYVGKDFSVYVFACTGSKSWTIKRIQRE